MFVFYFSHVVPQRHCLRYSLACSQRFLLTVNCPELSYDDAWKNMRLVVEVLRAVDLKRVELKCKTTSKLANIKES